MLINWQDIALRGRRGFTQGPEMPKLKYKDLTWGNFVRVFVEVLIILLTLSILF